MVEAGKRSVRSSSGERVGALQGGAASVRTSSSLSSPSALLSPESAELPLPDSTAPPQTYARPGSRPLLTIAVPTWNRAGLLAELLTTLAPQLRDLPAGEAELLLCDNGSTDDTAELVASFIDQGLAIHYHRHPVNLGSDANFISAFEMARGRYLWLFSDDDIIVPGALEDVLSHLRRAEFDLVYATSYSFRADWQAERHQDPIHRRFHTITSPAHLARVVNIMFTFISGIIINKERFEDLRRSHPALEDPSAFCGTNLTQLSWVLPLLRFHRRSLVLWQRPVAGRVGNGGGYSIGQVFGQNLAAVTARCLPDRPRLARILTNYTLRRWFPSQLFEIRLSGNQSFSLDQAELALRQTYGSNPRFWLFTWPVLKLPLFLAKLWLDLGAALSKLIYMVEIPGFWRKQT